MTRKGRSVKRVFPAPGIPVTSFKQYVPVITATTPVGPTHGFTIYCSVSTGFVEDRAMSTLTRSKGLLLIVSAVMSAGGIVNYMAMAHACNSSTHVGERCQRLRSPGSVTPTTRQRLTSRKPFPQASSCHCTEAK